jgi:hypothetical protein
MNSQNKRNAQTKKIMGNMNKVMRNNNNTKKDLRRSIDAYKGLKYDNINKYLWGKNNAENENKMFAKQLLKGIKEYGIRLSENLVVYRNFKYFNKNNISNIQRLKVDETKIFKGLMSTGLDLKILIEKSKSVGDIKDERIIKKNIGIITIPFGTPFFFANFQGEMEILLLPCKLKKTNDSVDFLGEFLYEIDENHIQQIMEKNNIKKPTYELISRNPGEDFISKANLIPEGSQLFDSNMVKIGTAKWTHHIYFGKEIIQTVEGNPVNFVNISHINLKKI